MSSKKRTKTSQPKVKLIYSKKATQFCEIFTLLLSYAVPVKSKVKILQNFVAFSEYMNFIIVCRPFGKYHSDLLKVIDASEVILQSRKSKSQFHCLSYVIWLEKQRTPDYSFLYIQPCFF